MTMFFVDRKKTLMLPETNTTYFKDLCSCGNDFFFPMVIEIIIRNHSLFEIRFMRQGFWC